MASPSPPSQCANFHKFILAELAVAYASRPLLFAELASLFARHHRCLISDEDLMRACEGLLVGELRLGCIARAELCGFELEVSQIADVHEQLRCDPINFVPPPVLLGPVEYANSIRAIVLPLIETRRQNIISRNRALLRQRRPILKPRPATYPPAVDVTMFYSVLGWRALSKTATTARCSLCPTTIARVVPPPRQLCLVRYASKCTTAEDEPILSYIPTLPDNLRLGYLNAHALDPIEPRAYAGKKTWAEVLREEEVLEHALYHTFHACGAFDRVVDALCVAFKLRARTIRRIVEDVYEALHRLERHRLKNAPWGMPPTRNTALLSDTFVRMFCTVCHRFACQQHITAPIRQASLPLSASLEASLARVSDLPDCVAGIATMVSRVTSDAQVAAKLVGWGEDRIRALWGSVRDWQPVVAPAFEASDQGSEAREERNAQEMNELRKRLRANYGKYPRVDFVPCDHIGARCGAWCHPQGQFCDVGCCCPPKSACHFPGCDCKSGCFDATCTCQLALRECVPLVCKHAEGSICGNVNCQSATCRPQVQVRESTVPGAGWGLFAICDFAKDAFVGEYTGEEISHDEAERRGYRWDAEGLSFLFEITPDRVIDSTRIGNEMRFINHMSDSARCNCIVRVQLVQGTHRVGVYAKQDIRKGDELFFNYSYTREEHLKVVDSGGSGGVMRARSP